MSEPGQGGAALTGPVAPGRSVRLTVAVLAVVASVVVALLAVALVVRLDVEGLPSGPPRDPPPAPPEASTFTVGPGRTVRFQELRMTLAGPPYRCSDAPAPPPTGFTAFVGCSHVVHAGYDAAGDDWSALTGMLLVDDSLVTAGDLQATTRSVSDAVVGQFYSADDRPSLSKVSDARVRLPVPADRFASRLGNVDVSRKGLATPYDRLVVVVLRLDSGRHVAFFSGYPHDGGRAGAQAVITSLSTISLTR